MKLKEGFIQIINSKSNTFLVFCFCFLLGVTLISLTEKFISFWYLASIVGVLLTAFFLWKSNIITRFIILSILFFTLGFVRYQSVFPADTSEYIHNYAENKVSFVGFVSSEPDIRQDGVRYRVRVERFIDIDKEIRGEVYLKSDLYPRYVYGEQLNIECQIEKPEPIEDKENGTTFRYDRYLSRMNIYALCQNPEINPTGEMKGNVFYSAIFSFKKKLANNIEYLWHEPYASFMAGLLYGYRGGLGSLNDLFATTGVTHIVAISGYNITIIATIFIAACKAVYIPRKKAFWVVITGIILFVIFTGASASVVRAGIMGVLVLVAKQGGRKSSIGNVLVLTAVIMTIHNPFVLIWDAGFQLSFLATIGLVYLSPILEKYITKLPNFLGLKESLISTLAAIIMTLPLILFQFGRLSMVAPLVNILILWIIPWIMIAGAVVVTLSFVSVTLAHILGFVGYMGMEYIIRVVRFFAHVPFASVELRIHYVSMMLLYVLLFGVMVKLKKST
ncbi:MAG: ComEC/Rec2 family competence protein [Candidatus Magasanikbacteria bacterium]|nr:ComEC/Rec2 family competence protein [Candidatus Magasanikbacteria bacterium]